MIRHRGNASDFIDELKRLNKDFTLKKTSNSTEINYMGMKFLYSVNEFQKKHLGLFSKMKSQVTKNIESKGIIVPDKIHAKYFDTGNFRQVELGEFIKFNNCVELDINKAYYNVLFNLGYIDEEFYQLCIKLPKQIRLALVGSLATQKTIFNYENGKLVSTDVKKNDLLRNVFFQLVSITDECLSVFQKLAGENFIFYWVDGIYLMPYPELDFHMKLIENKYNLTFSVESINRIIVFNRSKYNTIIASQKESKGRIKTFNFPCVFYND